MNYNNEIQNTNYRERFPNVWTNKFIFYISAGFFTSMLQENTTYPFALSGRIGTEFQPAWKQQLSNDDEQHADSSGRKDF